jgi:hypothetical protein
MEPESSLLCSQQSDTGPCLEVVYILNPVKVHFNIILSSTLRSPKCHLLFHFWRVKVNEVDVW